MIWWLVMVEGGSGPRQVTPTTKIAIAVAFALWLVVLLVFRARHQRVLKAAVARMEQETMEQETAERSRLRIAEEPSRPREGDDAEREDDSEAQVFPYQQKQRRLPNPRPARRRR